MCQLGGLWTDRCSQKVKNISHRYYDFGLNQKIAVYQGLNSIIAHINWVNVVWHSIMQSSVHRSQPEFAVFFISCVTFMEAKAVMTTSLWASSYFPRWKQTHWLRLRCQLKLFKSSGVFGDNENNFLGRRDWEACFFNVKNWWRLMSCFTLNSYFRGLEDWWKIRWSLDEDRKNQDKKKQKTFWWTNWGSNLFRGTNLSKNSNTKLLKNQQKF